MQPLVELPADERAHRDAGDELGEHTRPGSWPKRASCPRLEPGAPRQRSSWCRATCPVRRGAPERGILGPAVRGLGQKQAPRGMPRHPRPKMRRLVRRDLAVSSRHCGRSEATRSRKDDLPGLLRGPRIALLRSRGRQGLTPRHASRTALAMSDPFDPKRSFQGLILTLQRFWAEQGCVILQPYDMEVGAGTFHPATTLRALGPKPWRAAYVQASRRPKDGRYGENPNRLQHYYQFQVILKPSPREPPGSVSRLPRGDRHRHGPARRPLRRGRLGEPDAGRVGPRLGVLVRRHGGQPVHLLPAGRRHRMRAGLGRADLRPGAPSPPTSRVSIRSTS